MKLPRLPGTMSWVPGLASLLMMALLSGLIVYWGMLLAAPSVSIAPAGSLVGKSGGLDTTLASALFGRANGAGPIASAPLPRNIQVVGVAASADRSAAIISVDGQAAAAFGVGQSIDDDLKVISVSATEVIFEHRGEQIRVPAPPTGNLAALNQGDDGGSAPRADASNQDSRPAIPPSARRGPLANNRRTTSARPPLPPRRLPQAGASVVRPANTRDSRSPRINKPRNATGPIARSSAASGSARPQTQTALGQALQRVDRN